MKRGIKMLGFKMLKQCTALGISTALLVRAVSSYVTHNEKMS